MSDEIGRRNAAWAELKDTMGCSLLEAQKLAEEHGCHTCKMTMLSKSGAVIEADWLDAFMGMFRIKDDKEFITVGQVRKLGIELWVLSMVDGDGKNVPLKLTSENTPG